MLIECSKIKYQLFIPLIFPFFIQISNFLICNTGIINDNCFFKLFRYYLGYSLSGIFILIIKLRTRITKKQSEQLEESVIRKTKWINPLDLLKKTLIKEKKCKSYIFLSFLVIFGFISNICNDVILKIFFDDYKNEIYIGKQSFGVIFKALFLIIFCKIFLNMKIYKHHIVSLNLIIFNLLILTLSFILHYKTISIKVVLHNLVTSFFYCLFDIIGKKYLNLFCDSPYQIMLKIGVFSIILLFIYDLIVFIIFAIKGMEDTSISGVIVGIINNINIKAIIYIIFDIILCFLWNAGVWFTLYYLTPCHFIISESISEYIYNIINYFSGIKYESIYIIIYSIIYIINLFLFLVYDEIIILKFWDMDKYTKKMIERRESIDTNLSFGIKKELNELSTIFSEDKDNISSIPNAQRIGSIESIGVDE